ncbi:MAG TPA: hypothetical protein VF316_00260 [Polyangiaceae bacterium]
MKKLGKVVSLALRLALGTITVVGPLTAATTLAGCADENDPKTWVKRLDDPAQRATAVERLGNFYEDAYTKADKKRDNPELKALVDTMIEPMTTTYTKGGLDEKTRKLLIKELGDFRDPRTGPALAKAFNEYEAGKSDDDVQYASNAVTGIYKAGGTVDQAVIDALWNCFTKFAPTKSPSIKAVQALAPAVLAVKSPSYAAKAVEKLGATVILDEKGGVNDQLDFWQLISVQLLGELKFGPAARALVTVLMTPNKLKLASPAKTALLRIPKESVPLMAGALNGTDPDLAKLQADFGPEKGYVRILADILSYASTNAAKDAMLAAIPALDNDTNRAAVAQMLVLFPSDAKLVDAFKNLYGKLPPIADKGGGDDTGRERASLLQVGSEFYDASMVPWLLKEAGGAKGDNVILAQLGAIQAGTKLMQPDQKKAVGDALAALEKQSLAPVEKKGVESLRSNFTMASEVLDKCQKDVGCYLTALDTPVAASPEGANWRHIKAAAMCGMLGNEATRKALVDKLPKITNPGARLAASVAIDHLTPAGDKATADALDKIVDGDKEKNNADVLKGDDALVKVALRLRARAGQ